jgi:hypothetical protein
MARFFHEVGRLPSLVRLVFSALDQDEMDRQDAAAATRRARGARSSKEKADRTGPISTPLAQAAAAVARRDDAALAGPFSTTFDLRTVGGRALVAGFASSVVGFALIVWAHAPFQVSLVLGLVSVALAVVSVPAIPAFRNWLVLRRARREFEVCVSPEGLIVRTNKTVIRQWNLEAVSAVRVERRRLVVDGVDGASRILPIRFSADEDVTGVVERTRELIKDARALGSAKKPPKSKR